MRQVGGSIDSAHIEALCPELRTILDAELAAGNSVVETWTGWGHVVMLKREFLCAHAVDGTRVVYRDVNDPHYWKAQYSVRDVDQIVACRIPP
jgi:hypothetical protein